MTASARESVKELIEYDDSRASAPYEHCVTALAAGGLIAGAWLSRSRCGAVFQAVLGGVLLMRAASGQDGLRKWANAEEPAAPELIIAK